MQSNRPILSLGELEEYDPQAPGGSRRRFCCPLCGGQKPRDGAHRCLSLESSSGLWHCFRCGQSGQLREFWKSQQEQNTFLGPRRERARQALQDTFRLPPRQLEELPSSESNEASGETFPLEKSHAAPEAPVEVLKWRAIWEGALPLPNQMDKSSLVAGCEPGISYLSERRSLEIESCREAGVRFHPSWLGGAVVFPLCDRNGEVCAIQGRSVRGNAKITHGPKKEAAFAAPVTLPSLGQLSPLDRRTPVIVLVEAPIDALSLASCGFPALALCGTSGPSWLHLACGLREVVLAFDADEAGEKAAHALENRLIPYGSRLRRLKPEGFKDWNECLIAWGRDRLETSLLTQLF